MTVRIREATKTDFDKIWPIFHDIIDAGETYAFKQDINGLSRNNVVLLSVLLRTSTSHLVSQVR